MFKLSVYYNEVLRYTLVADMSKVQKLRDQGYYVVVNQDPEINSTVISSPIRNSTINSSSIQL
jgi:hypothetical protein